jgi:hypothetical protein
MLPLNAFDAGQFQGWRWLLERVLADDISRGLRIMLRKLSGNITLVTAPIVSLTPSQNLQPGIGLGWAIVNKEISRISQSSNDQGRILIDCVFVSTASAVVAIWRG